MRPPTALLVTLVVASAGCLGGRDAPPAPTPSPTSPVVAFAASSAAFADGAAIPREFTCDGANASPPLVVQGAPSAATTLALVVGDPDAPFPQAPQRNFTHWLLWNVPLRDGGATFEKGATPAGGQEGANDAGRNGWTGPCPPPGPAHRYVFTFHAVDGALDVNEGASRAQLESALEGRSLATTSLTGSYARQPLPTG